VLGASATKREAKAYLSRFDPKLAVKGVSNITRSLNIYDSGVNLGDLYLPVRSIEESPRFSQTQLTRPFVDPLEGPVHIALVAIRSPHLQDERTLDGTTKTLAQLSQLGLHCVVLVDSGINSNDQNTCNASVGWRKQLLEEADRVVAAIERNSNQQARRIDCVLSIRQSRQETQSTIPVQSEVLVDNSDLLRIPIERGIIPVVIPVATTETQVSVPVVANEAVLALIRDFIGISPIINNISRQKLDVINTIKAVPLRKSISLDRIIVLDPVGGIPTLGPTKRAHVFINLEQEYDLIVNALKNHRRDSIPWANKACSNSENQGYVKNQELPVKSHLTNLELVRNALKLLPPTSSALITSPQAVAGYGDKLTLPSTPGVGTRPKRNILIHNLLTDKPLYSSSLPTSRLASQSLKSKASSSLDHPTTFVKNGMPVTVLPDPWKNSWRPPANGVSLLSLSDPNLDIARLVHLIEDSFGRPLNQEHYFSRIASSLAGIIIVGAYEGGAILTWETPPSAPRGDTSRLVPYLDKFAVLKRSQGIGGVADIVFTAMVRDCFPNGVCWRSRSNNPVNKWYFERALGTWKLGSDKKNDSNGQSWTMFWTTPNLEKQQLSDYEEVCRSIQSSWADGRTKLD
jgi:amino-acid N-acetyltransferase